MTPPLFLVPHVVPGELVLTGDEGHHAAAVRRIRVGEQLDVGDGLGRVGRARVLDIGRGTVRVSVGDVAFHPAPQQRVVVAQALLKGDSGDRALAMMTEAGVDCVLPWRAGRCVTTWAPDREARGLARWRAVCREAAKQSHRAWFPTVDEAVDTKGLLGRVAGAAATVVLHESAPAGGPVLGLLEQLVAQVAAGGGTGAARAAAAPEVVLVVGPEGGITDSEVEALVAAGAVPVRLGDLVLRAATAGVVSVSLLSAALGRW